MKNIALIDGSPKINEKSVSKYLADIVAKLIGDIADKTYINIRQSFMKQQTVDAFKFLLKADAIIITFPLYIFCLPGILMRFLQDYQQFLLESGKTLTNKKVYAIVNCGFPEPEICLEAVRVIKSFCQHTNAQFRFGILIGGGGMLVGAEKAFFMKKIFRKLNDALLTIAKDIQGNDPGIINNVEIAAMPFPRKLINLMMNSFGWPSMARKNGLSIKDLYRKPYL
jgi:hypothetical protein